MASVAALIEEQGLADLSVSEVMVRADVSRTAFYRHFPDVYAVVAAILGRISQELQGRSGSWITASGAIGSPAVIESNLLSFARAYAEHGRLLAALSDATGVDDRVREIWREGLVQAFIDASAAAIARDQAAGALRADLDPEATAYALTMMGERLAYDLLRRHRRGGPEDYARILAPIWAATLFGVVPADDDPG